MNPKALRITTVKPDEGLALRITFSNRETRRFDIARWLDTQRKSSPAQALRDAVKALVGVKVADWGHTLEWPVLNYSLDAERVYEITLAQAGRDDAVAFRRWQERNALSLATAAEALGMTRRMMTNYRMGRSPVPRYIALACKGWEAERRASR